MDGFHAAQGKIEVVRLYLTKKRTNVERVSYGAWVFASMDTASYILDGHADALYHRGLCGLVAEIAGIAKASCCSVVCAFSMLSCSLSSCPLEDSIHVVDHVSQMLFIGSDHCAV